MNLLYLEHRFPYPRDKGDKVRAYHLLQHPVARHRLFRGTFVDDPSDEIHLDTVRALCAGAHIVQLHSSGARLRSLQGLLRGEALTLGYYRDAGLARWALPMLESRQNDAAVVLSSSMAQYVERVPGWPLLVDFVDVDSTNWSRFAEAQHWPLSRLYRREGRKLLGHGRAVSRLARRSYFVAAKEAALFVRHAPESAPLVVIGAMDYWPNIDAVTWFSREVLPSLRARYRGVHLRIVGWNPAAAFRAIAGNAVTFAGTAPDVRPDLQPAATVVAPLRNARWVRNKIVEAMANARVVVASLACVEAIDAAPERELVAADNAADCIREIDALAVDPARARRVGAAARRRVQGRCSRAAHLACIGQPLAAYGGGA